MSPHPRRRRVTTYVLHRWIGALSALVVLWLALTGYVLNHVSDWALDRRGVESGALLDWYGIDMPAPASGYAFAGGWVSESGGDAFWNVTALGRIGEFVGAASVADTILVAGAEGALLLSTDGALIERIESGRLPAAARSLGATRAGDVIDTAAGRFVADADLVQWRPLPSADTVRQWQAQPLPEALREQVRAAARARTLPWGRVLADLHSGRLFGRFGPAVIDLFAFAFMLLALSSLWMWARHLRHRRRRRQALARGAQAPGAGSGID